MQTYYELEQYKNSCIEEKICPYCGSKLKDGELDEGEPLMVYRCENLECRHISYKRLGGYEG